MRKYFSPTEKIVNETRGEPKAKKSQSDYKDLKHLSAVIPAKPNSRAFPSFIFDSLYYLNRDQLERFSIVCRPLKNFIERYFHSKPYRIFDKLIINGQFYTLFHSGVQCHPKEDDIDQQATVAYEQNIREFSDDESSDHKSDDISHHDILHYYFTEMRPYLGPTVRIKSTFIYIYSKNDLCGSDAYSPENIEEMESIAYLWRDYHIRIWNADVYHKIVPEDFQPILNSPSILQCRYLEMSEGHFPFKDFKVLYTVKGIESDYTYDDFEPSYWPEFLEQPGIKPVVVMRDVDIEYIILVLDRLKKAFAFAILPNAFKIVFLEEIGEPLTEFREMNKTSGEKLELKKGLPEEYRDRGFSEAEYHTLERSMI